MRWSVAGLVGTVLVAGCKQGVEELGTTRLKESLIGKDKGGSLAVTAEDCRADAAYCKYVGTSIVIPRGALTKDETIAMRVGRDSEGVSGALAGPAITFEPAGTTFASPVEIAIPIAVESDKDRIRVYVTEADGTKSVLLPYRLAYDRQAKTVRFLIYHFTTFQCGTVTDPCADVACPDGSCSNGQCNDPCDPTECGPAPAIPAWICDDGTTGGFTGECRRGADGTCGWVINGCTRACDPTECPDPAPGAPSYTCPDGSIAGPACTRADDGTCGWSFLECPNDCNGVACPPDHVCDPATGSCQPVNTACGDVLCAAGEYCCNPSCGTCAPLGAACTTEFCIDCNDPNGASCPPGSICDATTGDCIPTGTRCGPNVCGDGEYCCNESCGICAAAGSTCVEPACNDCSLVSCPPDHTCQVDPAGTIACVPNDCTDAECGPQPGVPTWTCEDGSIGGSTGRCLRSADGACGWEIIWCTPACDQAECGPPPPAGDPSVVCPDGSIPSFECVHDVNDVCAWQQSCN